MKDGYSRIEVYPNEEDALVRIEELTAEGKKESDIHAISEKSKGSSKIADRTDVHYKDASGSIGDKLSSFFSDYSEEAPEDKVLKKFELNESERNEVEDELLKGKVLLFLDTEEDGPRIVRAEEMAAKKESHNNVREDIRALDKDIPNQPNDSQVRNDETRRDEDLNR